MEEGSQFPVINVQSVERDAKRDFRDTDQPLPPTTPGGGVLRDEVPTHLIGEELGQELECWSVVRHDASRSTTKGEEPTESLGGVVSLHRRNELQVEGTGGGTGCQQHVAFLAADLERAKKVDPHVGEGAGVGRPEGWKSTLSPPTGQGSEAAASPALTDLPVDDAPGHMVHRGEDGGGGTRPLMERSAVGIPDDELGQRRLWREKDAGVLPSPGLDSNDS